MSERALIAEGLLSKVAERLAVLGHRAITTTGGWSLLSAYPRESLVPDGGFGLLYVAVDLPYVDDDRWERRGDTDEHVRTASRP